MSKDLIDDNKFYITTPIYYVNSNPHIGTLYSTLLADILARRARHNGKQTFFLTGLDEHGQKIAQAAEQKGVSPSEFVDSMTKKFMDVWSLFNISYDFFIRTTSEQHKASVLKVLEKLFATDQIYKSNYYGYYCTPDETFVPGYEEKVQEAVFCPNCSREVFWDEQEAYFFRLSNYTEQLLDFYRSHPEFVTPDSRLQEVISYITPGLKDLCVSRKNNKWGIQFPQDQEHTVYVWIDALSNYISAIGYGQESFESQIWWPADVHVLGKDIIKFHAAYWPAILMALGLNLPKKLLVHGYILIDGGKMSKSKGNSVDPIDLAQTYGVDQVRYYLARKMAISSDGNFSTQDLEETLTSDLANNLGNLISRICALADKRMLTNVQEVTIIDAGCLELIADLKEALERSDQQLEKLQIHMAINELLAHLSKTNALVQSCKPWKADYSEQSLSQLLWTTCNSITSVVEILSFVMPTKCEQILDLIGYKKEMGRHFSLKKLDTPLFVKDFPKEETVSTESTAKEPEVKPMDLVTIDEFLKVKLAVGTIEQCTEVPNSDKLYKLMVNFGQFGVRQILSGIKKHFQPEDLIAQQVCFVLNLHPRKMMGLESQGMILTAQDGNGKIILVSVKHPSTNGFILQ